jgi:hypothetical protein
MVFRLGRDAGAGYLPEQRSEMKDLPRRHVMGTPIGCLDDDARNALTHMREHQAIGLQQDGLLAMVYQAPAHHRIAGCDPSLGRGQFIYIAAGAAIFNEHMHKAGTAIFISATEPMAVFTAGPQGAEILLMQFPRNGQ